MKKYLNHKGFVMLAVVGMLSLFSCEQNEISIDEPLPDDIRLTIEDVKSIYQGVDIQFGEDIKHIYGTVISDDASGNVPEGYLVIQQESTGITIPLADSPADTPFKLGDSVTVNISGSMLVRKEGNLMITGPSSSDVTKLAENRSVTANQVLLADLVENFDKYQSTLVTVVAADIVPVPGAGETYSGSKALFDASIEAGAVKLYTFPEADLAAEEAKANANYSGIAMYSEGETSGEYEKQLWMRNEGDIKITSIPLTADIVITGILANSRGSDGPVKGSKVSYSSTGVTVVHDGGYEYIQLMALRDIDFSATPFSVVTCNNGSATAKGWAEGGARTMKFNLTEGFAAQGTFFYVGGPSKVIGGYYPTGKSTNISHANWIRTIDYNVGDATKVVGDGFGNSTGGLLGNGSPADGIAVFEGTEVTPSSVPIDAVFFNPPAGSTFDGTNGYLIPSSDLYSPLNKETGESQPFFGQGTNTFAVEEVGGGDISRFAQMGGVVTENSWIAPRNPTIITLQPDSKLDEIEVTGNVTFFRK